MMMPITRLIHEENVAIVSTKAVLNVNRVLIEDRNTAFEKIESGKLAIFVGTASRARSGVCFTHRAC